MCVRITRSIGRMRRQRHQQVRGIEDIASVAVRDLAIYQQKL